MKDKSTRPIGILLLNLGGPDSLEAVRPFLFNLFSDQEIIKLPLQPLLARIISWRRAKKVKERYREIGGGSPLLQLTLEQAKSLEKELNSQTPKLPNSQTKFKVYVAMRYWHPFIAETIKEIKKDGIDQVVALGLFPQYSRATTGSCFKELKKVLRKQQNNIKVSYVESWYDHPKYIEALAEKVTEALNESPEGEQEEVEMIFSAHSLPQDFVDQGDPYVGQLKGTIAGVLKHLEKVKSNQKFSWHLVFQSRSGPVKWLEPATDAMIEKLARKGHKQILMIPLSFVSDHIETLYEIDIMYRELAESEGVTAFRRSSSLNSSPKFISALAAIVQEYIGKI